MSTKENRSIAYIYNEMDPSEKLEFERDLKGDSDLLIEVESLKNVSKSLSKLEHFQPPAHVVDAVCETAQKKSASLNNYWQVFLYSAAALILVGLTSGIFLMDNPDGVDQSQTEAASVSGSPVFSQPIQSSSSENFTPWVDNNDILYFQGQANSGSEVSVDSVRSNSYKKLTPVTDPTLVRPYERLQLTGSHN